MLAIIPARGGSKGLPGKNIKMLCGKPLIAYTIEAALKSNFISKVVVSTDDKDIAEVATNYGAGIPFLRPPELATDNAKAIDVYLYTVEALNNRLIDRIEEFVVLQPTSPLRDHNDIDNAIEIFKAKKTDSIISIVESEHPPEWYKKISSIGTLEDYIKGKNNLNRQEYEKTYLPNGAIYIFKYSILKKNLGYYTENTFPYVMQRERSIDIDTILDFYLTELILRDSL